MPGQSGSGGSAGFVPALTFVFTFNAALVWLWFCLIPPALTLVRTFSTALVWLWFCLTPPDFTWVVVFIVLSLFDEENESARVRVTMTCNLAAEIETMLPMLRASAALQSTRQKTAMLIAELE